MICLFFDSALAELADLRLTLAEIILQINWVFASKNEIDDKCIEKQSVEDDCEGEHDVLLPL